MNQKTRKAPRPIRKAQGRQDPKAVADGPRIFRTVQGKPPLWEGPTSTGPEGGLTFSLLSRWLVCRDRFRLKVVEGVDEDEGFRPALEYGSLWHEAEEAHAGGKPWLPAMRKYYQHLMKTYQADQGEVRKWFLIAKATFPVYIHWWKTHATERARKPLMEEVAFRVPYRLPSGRSIILRGKFDCVFLERKSVLLQENKSKGRIDEQGIQNTTFQNLQTGIYQTSLRTSLKKTPEGRAFCPDLGDPDLVFPIPQGARITGTLYNVVRRPLADPFGPGSIRQKKKETEGQFYKRLAQTVEEQGSKFFHRWKIQLNQTDIQTFQDQVLHPILEQFLDWWEWIELDPAHPFRLPTHADLERTRAIRGLRGGGLHWRSPWGVYSSLGQGFRGDFFDYLTTGQTQGLKSLDTLFPEL